MGARHFYCSICGVVLSPSESENYPEWCKVVRAVCNLEPHLPSLTGIGFVDDHVYPFNLRIADVPRHFKFKENQQIQDDSCFPFHAACWELYRDYSESTSMEEEDHNILYNVLNSIWYNNGALGWGHDYGGASSFQGYRWLDTDMDSHLMADPRLSLEYDLLKEHETGEQSPKDPAPSSLNLGKRAINAPDPFWTVPDELISEILSYLSSIDVFNLRLASAMVALVGLSADFWKSRFLPQRELGFARSFRRPETFTWKSWYLLVKEQCKRGPKHRNLMNRKRIWLLAGYLVELVNTVKARIAFGSSTSALTGWSSQRVTSVPPKHFRGQGCRELTHRVASLNSDLMSRLCGLKISSVLIAKQRFVSGLRFIFSSGESARIGYVDDRNEKWASFESGALHSSLLLQMILSSEGFKAVSLGTTPLRQHSELLMNEDSISAQIPLENLCDLMVGLDAMRIVSISASFAVKYDMTFESLSWARGLPPSTPFIHEANIIALKSYQQYHVPASHVIFGKPSYCGSNSALLVITVFTTGQTVGITGVRFVYADGAKMVWGACRGVALTFFMNGTGESIVAVETYQVGSFLSKLKLTTDLKRTCSFPGKLEGYPDPHPEEVSRKYFAKDQGSIVGFCGCFAGLYGSLACLGIFTDTSIVCRPGTLELSLGETSFTDPEKDMGIKFGIHGEFSSHIKLNKHYDSVQASVDSLGGEFRGKGQITGLLFRTRSDYPDLIGQWVEPGERHSLAADEHILDVKFTTCRGSDAVSRKRAGLSQIKGLALVTSCRILSWGRGCECLDYAGEQKLASITWNFNSVFDQITPCYK